jgi:hypothetical protein
MSPTLPAQSSTELPAPFADLQAFCDDWALATEFARSEKRATSSMADLKTYYAAVGPRMEAIARHLDQFPMDALPAAEKQLLYMALSYMEVAIAVEFFNQPEVPNGFPREKWRIQSSGN